MPRLSAPTIALLGDDQGHVCHQDLNALVPRLDAAVYDALRTVAGARADDAGGEVLIFPTTSFFVTSMFQPHIGASSEASLHPLIRAFVEAAGVPHR